MTFVWQIGQREMVQNTGLVYWSLAPQQQPGSYQGGDDDGKMSVSLVEETGVPGGNHLRQVTDKLSHIWLVQNKRSDNSPEARIYTSPLRSDSGLINGRIPTASPGILNHSVLE